MVDQILSDCLSRSEVSGPDLKGEYQLKFGNFCYTPINCVYIIEDAMKAKESQFLPLHFRYLPAVSQTGHSLIHAKTQTKSGRGENRLTKRRS